MAKVTSKLQVTLPKVIADQYKIHPGDEIAWVAAGDVIRVIPQNQLPTQEEQGAQLRLFDQATERQRKRSRAVSAPRARSRGWKREDLYTRGGSH